MKDFKNMSFDELNKEISKKEVKIMRETSPPYEVTPKLNQLYQIRNEKSK